MYQIYSYSLDGILFAIQQKEEEQLQRTTKQFKKEKSVRKRIRVIWVKGLTIVIISMICNKKR